MFIAYLLCAGFWQCDRHLSTACLSRSLKAPVRHLCCLCERLRGLGVRCSQAVPKQLGAGQPRDQPRVCFWEWGWLQAGGREVTVSHVRSGAAEERKGQ